VRWAWLFLLAVLSFTVAATTAAGADPAPTAFVARDNPGDSGGAVLLTWTPPDSSLLPAGSVLEIRRAEAPAFEWKSLADAALGAKRYVDQTAQAEHVYRYELRVKSPAGAVGPAAVSEPASAHDDWFRIDRTNSFIATIIFLVAVLGSITLARSGKPIFIRKIAGLNAVDEAIGRATETGKKVLYVPGIQSMDDIQTVASMSVLGHVARV